MPNDLPPEAFTRETLQEAFNWLQNQPEAISGHVHTPERLVSLYQKSQRLNDQDAPVSSKKFITDLKNLATSLDQFSDEGQGLENPVLAPNPVVMPPPPAQAQEKTPSTPVAAPMKTNGLDSLTQQRLQKVQSRLNLSSEQEAMRMLIALGYEKFSQIE